MAASFEKFPDISLLIYIFLVSIDTERITLP